MEGLDHAENLARMRNGQLYYAFTPELIAARDRCRHACHRFNTAGDASRRRLVDLWKDVVDNRHPLHPESPDEDGMDFEGEPYIDGPIKVDYGTNLKLGKGVYINNNCTFLDTCTITIGARTLIGPNCSFFAASHPLDPFLRNGTSGPELGAPITVGEDCWFGGGAIVLMGVKIGRGVTIGAGSVVTKDVPDFHVAAGNPARIIRRIDATAPDPKVNPVEK